MCDPVIPLQIAEQEPVGAIQYEMTMWAPLRRPLQVQCVRGSSRQKSPLHHAQHRLSTKTFLLQLKARFRAHLRTAAVDSRLDCAAFWVVCYISLGGMLHKGGGGGGG